MSGRNAFLFFQMFSPGLVAECYTAKERRWGFNRTRKKNKCRRAYRIHFWVRKCGWFRLRQNLQPFTTKFRRTKELRQIAVGVKPQRDAAKLNLSSKSVWRDVYMILIRSITVICCMTFKCRARRDASFTGWGTSF